MGRLCQCLFLAMGLNSWLDAVPKCLQTRPVGTCSLDISRRLNRVKSEIFARQKFFPFLLASGFRSV
jgi:hypothetical protein